MIHAITREQVRPVVDGRSIYHRVPMSVHFWVHSSEFGDRKQAVLDLLAKYPEDVAITSFRIPEVFHAPPDALDFRWAFNARWDLK